MTKITASRLSDGNKLWPAEITIEENGLNVKIPGFFRGQSTFLAYMDISAITVDTPLMGYSTIRFNAQGSHVVVHGFTKDEVRRVKTAVEEGKQRGPAVSSGGGYVPTGANQSSSTGLFGLLNEHSRQSNEYLAEKRREDNEKEQAIQGKVEELASITFSNDANEIANILNQLVSIASAKPDKKVKNTIVEKMEFGIMKLRSLNAPAEANYFEQKLAPLKKRGLFG